ncbi:UNVERIFIED_CONTAM: outer membrane murein-binding lipoprotein Lpp [Paenibacillus sp. PvR008]
MGELSSHTQSVEPQTGSARKLAVVATVISGIAVLGCISLALWNYNLNTKVNTLITANTSLNKTTQELTKQQKDTEALLKRVQLAANLSAISHILEQTSVVTDDFVLEKVTFDVTDDGTLKGVLLNVNNQPNLGFGGAYKGYGKYNMASDALTKKAEEVIDIAMKQYNAPNKLPVWDKNTKVEMTVQNYELGKREGGIFKLTSHK